jgi:hypothetical protein
VRVPKFTRTHRVTPWGGTTEDVGRVVREAQRLVSDATDEELKLSLSVTRPGRVDEYDSPDEFEDVGGDLRSIKMIYTRVSPTGFLEKVSAVVIFYKGRAGAWLSVEGSSEVSVRGVALALQAVLEEGRRARARWTLWWFGLVFCVGSIASNALASATTIEHRKIDVTPLVIGLVLLVLGVLLLRMWFVCFPGMELRRVGEPTRLQRLFGQPVKWLLGIILLAAITAAIGAILAKLI